MAVLIYGRQHLDCPTHTHLKHKHTHTNTAAPARLTAREMVTELVPYAKLIGTLVDKFDTRRSSVVLWGVWVYVSFDWIWSCSVYCHSSGWVLGCTIVFFSQLSTTSQPPQGTAHTSAGHHQDKDNDDEGEDEARAASLASALGFLRLFNRRCCPLGGNGPDRGAATPAEGQGDGGDLDVDDIVEED